MIVTNCVQIVQNTNFRRTSAGPRIFNTKQRDAYLQQLSTTIQVFIYSIINGQGFLNIIKVKREC